MPLKLVKALLLVASSLYGAVAVDNTPIDQNLFVPFVRNVKCREGECIVFHSNVYKTRRGGDNNPRGVDCWLIEFGPVNLDFPAKIVQNQQYGQMQLLDPGIQFRGRIFSFGRNADGEVRKSQSSALFFFRSKSTDVNRLRAQTIFFDDFNEAASDYFEGRWNVAHTIGAKTKLANFNVNVQEHMHTQVGALLNRGIPFEALTARARAEFDFSEGAKIFVDLDGGGFPGHKIFLEVSEEAKDLGLAFGQKNVIRLALDFSQLQMEQVRADGNALLVPGSRRNLFARGDDTFSLANIRKTWEIEMDRNKMSLTINGVKVLQDISFPERLAFEKGHVSLTAANIRSSEGGVHAVTMHIDNFGFTSAQNGLELQTFNYRNVAAKGWTRAGRVIPIEIPAVDFGQIGDAVAARIHFTTSGVPTSGNTVTLTVDNDVLESKPVPQSSRRFFDTAVHAIEIDTASLATAQDIRLIASRGFYGNVHIEIDYDCSEPNLQFTPPDSQPIFAAGFPVSFSCDLENLARPHVETKLLAGRRVNGQPAPINDPQQIDMVVDINCDRELFFNGGCQGLKTLNVLVDCVNVVKTIDLSDGSAFKFDDFALDFAIDDGIQGIREIAIQVIDNEGRSSTFDSDGRDEVYIPQLIQIGNAAVPASATPGVCANFFLGGDCDDEGQFTEGTRDAGVCRNALAPPEPDLNAFELFPPARSATASYFPQGNYYGQRYDSRTTSLEGQAALKEYQETTDTVASETPACKAAEAAGATEDWMKCSEAEPQSGSKRPCTGCPWLPRPTVPGYTPNVEDYPETDVVGAAESALELELVWVDRATGRVIGNVDLADNALFPEDVYNVDIEARLAGQATKVTFRSATLVPDQVKADNRAPFVLFDKTDELDCSAIPIGTHSVTVEAEQNIQDEELADLRTATKTVSFTVRAPPADTEFISYKPQKLCSGVSETPGTVGGGDASSASKMTSSLMVLASAVLSFFLTR